MRYWAMIVAFSRGLCVSISGCMERIEAVYESSRDIICSRQQFVMLVQCMAYIINVPFLSLVQDEHVKSGEGPLGSV